MLSDVLGLGTPQGLATTMVLRKGPDLPSKNPVGALRAHIQIAPTSTMRVSPNPHHMSRANFALPPHWARSRVARKRPPFAPT